MAAYLVPTSHKGNGHTFPLSRKAFHRGLPRRIGALEDQLDRVERQLDAFVCRVIEIEARPVTTGPDPGLSVRVDNLVDVVGRLAEQLRRVDKRSTRARRKLAVISDQVESQFE